MQKNPTLSESFQTPMSFRTRLKNPRTNLFRSC